MRRRLVWKRNGSGRGSMPLSYTAALSSSRGSPVRTMIARSRRASAWVGVKPPSCGASALWPLGARRGAARLLLAACTKPASAGMRGLLKYESSSDAPPSACPGYAPGGPGRVGEPGCWMPCRAEGKRCMVPGSRGGGLGACRVPQCQPPQGQAVSVLARAQAREVPATPVLSPRDCSACVWSLAMSGAARCGPSRRQSPACSAHLAVLQAR